MQLSITGEHFNENSCLLLLDSWILYKFQQTKEVIIMSSGKEILAKLEAAEKAYAEIKEQLKSESEVILAEVFKEVFNTHPGLKKFVFRGSTPSFNDGEPCVHSSESCAAAWQIKKYFMNGETYVSYVSYGDLLEYDEIVEFFDFAERDDGEEGATSCNDDCKDLIAVEQQLLNLERLVDLVYETNYQVFVELNDDGSVSVGFEEYDCGY